MNKTKLNNVEEDIFTRVFGSWKKIKDSVDYLKSLRKDWEEREKKFS